MTVESGDRELAGAVIFLAGSKLMDAAESMRQVQKALTSDERMKAAHLRKRLFELNREICAFADAMDEPTTLADMVEEA